MKKEDLEKLEEMLNWLMEKGQSLFDEADTLEAEECAKTEEQAGELSDIATEIYKFLNKNK